MLHVQIVIYIHTEYLSRLCQNHYTQTSLDQAHSSGHTACLLYIILGLTSMNRDCYLLGKKVLLPLLPYLRRVYLKCQGSAVNIGTLHQNRTDIKMMFILTRHPQRVAYRLVTNLVVISNWSVQNRDCVSLETRCSYKIKWYCLCTVTCILNAPYLLTLSPMFPKKIAWAQTSNRKLFRQHTNTKHTDSTFTEDLKF